MTEIEGESLHALVTGGGRGIGRAVSRTLAELGYRVGVCARSRRELEETVALIRTGGGEAYYLAVDVGTPEGCQRLAERALREGDVDILVHCAGATPPIRTLEETSAEAWDKTLATNVGALFHLCRLLVPRMKARRRGMVVAMSSGCGLKGHPGMAAYSASKFAVQGLIQALARESADSGLHALAINPGGVDTRMLVDLFGAEESAKNQPPAVVAEVVRRVVQGTLATPNGGGVVVRRGQVEVYAMPDGAKAV